MLGTYLTYKRSLRGPAAVIVSSVAVLIRPVPRNRSFFSSAMDVQKAIDSIQPLVGQAVPVKTVQETQPFEDFGMLKPPGRNK